MALSCTCPTHGSEKYDQIDVTQWEAEAELILQAEQELVELRWNMTKARSAAELQVEALMKEVEALKKSEPELAEEIAAAVEQVQSMKEAEKADAEREALEAERAAAAETAEERQAEVKAFLKKYDFVSVSKAKRSWFFSSYALHKAVKLHDVRMVELLLLEGAQKDQKESGLFSKKTAVQLAKTGKYADATVLRLLEHDSKASK